MQPWEIEARESIRDIVSRYNANGDTGRFAQVIECFADDAVMDIGDGRFYEGIDEILTIFTGTRDAIRPADGPDGETPTYVRHFTATHQIDVLDETNAKGRCYYSVITPVGLDHWGRYVDTYRKVGDRWLFATRKVTVDGRSADSRFPL